MALYGQKICRIPTRLIFKLNVCQTLGGYTFSAIFTYNPSPPWVLDTVRRCGLQMMTCQMMTCQMMT
jgi:hypothetical protein